MALHDDALTRYHCQAVLEQVQGGGNPSHLGAQVQVQKMIDSLVKNGLYIEYVHMEDHTEMRICRSHDGKTLALARVPYAARRSACDPDAANLASLRRLHELAVLTYRRDRLIESTQDVRVERKVLGVGQLCIGNRILPALPAPE